MTVSFTRSFRKSSLCLLFGALAYRAFSRPPTASEIFTAAMKRAAIDARHTLATGLTAARRFVK